MPNVVFHVTAGQRYGFGHCSRSLALADLVRDVATVAFTGELDRAAEDVITARGYEWRTPASQSDVAVIDMMFDAEDMDAYDVPRIAAIAATAKRTMLLSSAASCPDVLPVDEVIGYHLRTDHPATTSYAVRWGLAYAPVAPTFAAYAAMRRVIAEDVRRVCIAFGGSETATGIATTLRALTEHGFTGAVDLLLSPLHARFRDELVRVARALSCTIHQHVPSVAPLFWEADLLIGSFGNVTYEALCLGCPTIVVGVKEFQVRYADQLAAAGLLISAGHADRIAPEMLRATLRTMDRAGRAAFAERARRALDAQGIVRIAERIREMLPTHASPEAG